MARSDFSTLSPVWITLHGPGCNTAEATSQCQACFFTIIPSTPPFLLLSLAFTSTRISSVGLWTVSLEGGNASGYLSPSSSRSNQLVFQWAYLAPPAWHYLLQVCLPGIAGPELLSCFSFSLLSSHVVGTLSRWTG